MDYVINPNTLKTLRNRRLWTQMALQAESGVDRKTIMRIEGDKPYRVRANTAKELAAALDVSIETLTKELPDSEKVGESQIFIDLDRALKDNDQNSSRKIVEYLACKLAYALDCWQVELDDGWISRLCNAENPTPELTPQWQPYFDDTEPHNDAFAIFLKELRRDREKASRDAKFKSGVILPASTNYFLCGDLPHDLKEAFLKLPIRVNGKIDAYRVRAYFRKMSGVPSENLQLVLVPNIEEEMWAVVPYSEG